MDNTQPNQTPSNIYTPIAPTPLTQPKGNGKNKAVYISVLVLLLIIAAGLFFWQNAKTSDANNKLKTSTTKVTTLTASNKQLETDLAAAKSKLSPAAASAANDTKSTTSSDVNADLYPGQADVNRSDGKIYLNASFKRSLNPSALWAEYGTSPTELTKSTAHSSDGLAAGEATTYVHGYFLTVPSSSVNPGSTYFYRIAATIGGKTVYGPVATFTTTK